MCIAMGLFPPISEIYGDFGPQTQTLPAVFNTPADGVTLGIFVTPITVKN